MVKLKVGDSIPEFKVKDHDGYDLADEDIVGIPIVIYFYPKDETPGCTQEACDFHAKIGEFDKLDTLVLGVSPDSIESHKRFIEKHNLDFTLLSDGDLEMARAFGVVSDGKIVRSTFVIDMDGVIKWIEQPVKELGGHIDRVIAAVREHCPMHIDTTRTLEEEYGEFLKEAFRKQEEKKK